MTEDEAKTKWCPFARVTGLRSESANRETIGGWEALNGANRCIGSACMAWRWKFVQTNKPPLNQISWPVVEPIYERTDQGGCGLAGTPT